ncbi:MAG: FMN-binding protein [Candidatus Omnitrophica bacterium]|nr:FMN-binding protein [Candidatus Omnitrophota bacterium]
MFKRNIALIVAVLFIAGIGSSLVRHRGISPGGTVVKAAGYGGVISLEMNRGPDGSITELILLDHNETPSCINDPANFLKQFSGKKAQDALALGKDIDGITGATVTSRAITDAVRATLKSEKLTTGKINPWNIILPLALLALALFALFLRSPLLRWAAMTAAGLYLGFISKAMFSLAQAANASLLHFPLFAVNSLWWMTLALSIIPAFIIGRLYCSSLCPFALIQELLARIPKKQTRSPQNLPVELQKTSSVLPYAHVKYLILIIVLALCFILGDTSAANIEVFITFFTGRGLPLAWVTLTLALTASVFYGHFWCRYLCPAGALLGTCASLAPLKIRAAHGCNSCGACLNICPVEAITAQGTSVEINNAECLLCGKCLRACSKNILALRKRS